MLALNCGSAQTPSLSLLHYAFASLLTRPCEVASMEDLARKLESLLAEQADVTIELKRRRSQAAALHLRDKWSGFTPYQAKVSVGIFLELMDEKAAVSYLSRCVRSSRAQAAAEAGTAFPESDHELVDLLLTWVLEEDLQELVAGSLESDQDNIWKAARAFAAEWKTITWVRAANAKGVAPNSSSLAAAHSLQGPGEPVERAKRSQKRWAQRFRKRWCLARRLPPTKPPLSTEVLLAKVLAFILIVSVCCV